MPALFHQNLRKFGGGDVDRNAAYLDVFSAIARQAEATDDLGPIWIAGGTEITNAGQAGEAWGGLCAALGLAGDQVVACGISALNTREFIGLGVHPGLQVLSRGRIFLNTNAGRVFLHHDIEDPDDPEWATQLPDEETPDYRSIVYVVVRAAKVPAFAAGFLHNAYTNQDIRALIAAAGPGILATMRSNPAFGRQEERHAFLGGDFNVSPERRGTARTGYAFAYSCAISEAQLHDLPPGAKPGGTTMAGNLYDYWYSDIPSDNPVALFPGATMPPDPFLSIATLDTGRGHYGLLSDHAASLLQIG